MTRENPKRVGPGLISAPSQSRGISDTRHRANPQSQQHVELSIAPPLLYDSRRRLSLSFGPGLDVDSSGRLYVTGGAASGASQSQACCFSVELSPDVQNGDAIVYRDGRWITETIVSASGSAASAGSGLDTDLGLVTESVTSSIDLGSVV